MEASLSNFNLIVLLEGKGLHDLNLNLHDDDDTNNNNTLELIYSIHTHVHAYMHTSVGSYTPHSQYLIEMFNLFIISLLRQKNRA